jgi:hypothetical protein
VGAVDVCVRFVLVVFALAVGGCALRSPAVHPPDPLEIIPQNWIDLPESPFIAKVINGKRSLSTSRNGRSTLWTWAACVKRGRLPV